MTMRNEVGKLESRDDDRVNTGIRELLSSLPQTELAGLLKTVTNTLVHFGSVPRDENGKPITDATTHAIHSILMYSDAISLLNRSRMKKAYLAEYLNQKCVKMTMPATKTSLCKDVLHLWGQTMPENVTLIEDELPDERIQSLRCGQITPAGTSCTGETTNRNRNLPGTSGQGAGIFPSISVQNGIINHGAVAVSENQVSGALYENAMSLRHREADMGQQLGMQFSAWYYERLNTLTDFTISHFWNECNFRLEIVFAAEPENAVIEEIMMDGEATCAKIKDLVAVKLLYFNPNPDSGIRGYLNPHGLAQVMVCGGLFHRDGYPVGVFEQMFGLMKDARFGNNFKIKFSVLRLREGGFLAIQNTPPELCDSTLVGIVEEIDDD